MLTRREAFASTVGLLLTSEVLSSEDTVSFEIFAIDVSDEDKVLLHYTDDGRRKRVELKSFSKIDAEEAWKMCSDSCQRMVSEHNKDVVGFIFSDCDTHWSSTVHGLKEGDWSITVNNRYVYKDGVCIEYPHDVIARIIG